MKYNKIIWISLDTLRADCIGFNKHKLYPKEYKIIVGLDNSKLDELCKNGCFFSNAISAAPYTSASHAAYFTGLWPKHNGLYDQFNSKLTAENVFQIAKKSGYKTLFKTDFPFILGKYLNMIKGVDKYIIEDNSKILSEIKNNKKVFSFVHFGQIHYPYGFHNIQFGGKDYIAKISELRKKYHIDFDNMNLDDMAIETFRTKKDLALLYQYKKIIATLYSAKKDDDLFNLYLEGINYFHKNLFNNFLDNLLKAVEKDNYLIIISADHGEAWNDESYGHHNSLDEGVIRVPILFYAKDIKPFQYDNRIRTIDVLPTLNEVLFKSKKTFDGKSLHKIIYNNKMEKNRFAFSAIWVSELKDVLRNVNTIIQKDTLSTKANVSIKYSAAIYSDNYKYIVNYKKFTNRGEHIIEFPREQLLSIKILTVMKQINDSKKKKQFRKITDEYNSPKIQKHKSHTQVMKEYFNLQGYKI
jgi:hypothetical protein